MGRFLLVTSLLAFACAILWSAITLQSAVPVATYGGGTLCASGSSVTTQTCSIAVNAGDQVVVFVAGHPSITVADQHSNNYASLGGGNDASGTRRAEFFFQPNTPLTETLTIKATTSAAGYMSLNVLRYTGAATSSYQDGSAASANATWSSGVALPCGSLTTGSTTDVVLAGFNSAGFSGTMTAPAGFTKESQQPNSGCCEASGVADQIVAPTTTINSPTWVTSNGGGASVCSMVALKQVSSGKVKHRVIQ